MINMAEKLKILILEDVEFDAELTEHEMRREGLDFVSRRVETEEGFIHALEEFNPDVVLVDHSLPQFDGVTALDIVKVKSPETPLIFVSGKIGEEFAVEVLKMGAKDYVFKNNLSKLVPAIKRALKERSELLERKKAEKELKTAYNQMEEKIQNRTHELSQINQRLMKEITERNKVGEALKKSENKYKSLLLAIPDLMFIITKDGTIIDFRASSHELAITKDKIIGINISSIGLSDADLKLALEKIKKSLEYDTLENFEYELKVASSLNYYEARVKRLNNREVLCIVRDITNKRKAEDKLNKSLKEKDILLKEIHHRVKNNLQIVSSLLSLQSQHIKEPDSVEVFKESQSRIISMALIHEKLYQTGDLTQINLSEYANELVNDLFRSYSVNTSRVKFKIESNDFPVDINTAIPCGLIINELITNSIKHAFPDDRNGEIKMEIRCHGENCRIKIGDNGVGLPENLDINDVNTLGLKLVTNLTRQLDGTIELDRDDGTSFTIKFNEFESNK